MNENTGMVQRASDARKERLTKMNVAEIDARLNSLRRREEELDLTEAGEVMDLLQIRDFITKAREALTAHAESQKTA